MLFYNRIGRDPAGDNRMHLTWNGCGLETTVSCQLVSSYMRST